MSICIEELSYDPNLYAKAKKEVEKFDNGEIGKGELKLRLSHLHSGWYLLYVIPGQEFQAKKELEKRIETLGLEHKIFEVFSIPRGAKSEDQKAFTGYLLVRMVLDDETFTTTVSSSKIKGFVGPYAKPYPINENEARRMIRRGGLIDEEKKKEEPSTVEGKEGQEVVIKDGAFCGFKGIVKEILPAKGKVKVMIEVFGRETLTEVDSSQVEAI